MRGNNYVWIPVIILTFIAFIVLMGIIGTRQDARDVAKFNYDCHQRRGTLIIKSDQSQNECIVRPKR